MDFDLPAPSLSPSHGARVLDVGGGESHTYTVAQGWASGVGLAWGNPGARRRGDTSPAAAETLRAAVLPSDFPGITLTF